jgi:hypothetical protein
MGLETNAERDRLGRRLALNQRDAASALDVSVDYFSEHVAPELPVIRRGRMRLYPVKAMEEWLQRNAELPAVA